MAAAEKPGVGLLGGFLEGIHTRDSDLADSLLDEAWFPVLQAFVAIKHTAVARLHRALALGRAPITAYYNLAYGRACDELSGPDFKSLVLAVNTKPGGNSVSMEILSMRIHSDGSNKKISAPEVAEAGRTLLAAYSFERTGNRYQREDYELGVIVRASLMGDEGKPIERQLCRGLLAAAASHSVSA